MHSIFDIRDCFITFKTFTFIHCYYITYVIDCIHVGLICIRFIFLFLCRYFKYTQFIFPQIILNIKSEVVICIIKTIYEYAFVDMTWKNKAQTPVLEKEKKTRGPKFRWRSPEYNERVKILISAWNQKQQHLFPHASRSLLCMRFVAVAFRSEEEVFWRRESRYLFLPCPRSALWQIWPKHINAYAGPWYYTDITLSWRVWLINWLSPKLGGCISPTDCPKSFHNRCVIEHFW